MSVYLAEKYIYEYRGFLFRIHTWRQIELLSVWFVGILAVIGAALSYMEGGLTETVYQYIAGRGGGSGASYGDHSYVGRAV